MLPIITAVLTLTALALLIEVCFAIWAVRKSTRTSKYAHRLYAVFLLQLASICMIYDLSIISPDQIQDHPDVARLGWASLLGLINLGGVFLAIHSATMVLRIKSA